MNAMSNAMQESMISEGERLVQRIRSHRSEGTVHYQVKRLIKMEKVIPSLYEDLGVTEFWLEESYRMGAENEIRRTIKEIMEYKDAFRRKEYLLHWIRAHAKMAKLSDIELKAYELTAIQLMNQQERRSPAAPSEDSLN